ncbi:MAG TPA: hypothetical protein EYG85_10830 [Crocinitomix sp.]|nr:hypothetical protein [Crocinitomix sp.]
MNRLFAKIGIFSLLLGFLAIGTFSCRKEGPTIAIITVVDTAGLRFPNAMVRLYPTPTTNPHPGIIIDDTLYTDEQGEAVFDYTDMYNLGQAGFAVLDIEVRSGDTLYGEGIIKVEAEATSEETVILQP